MKRGSRAPREVAPDLTPIERVRLIVRAHRAGHYEPTVDDVARQYHYETGEEMDMGLYERATR